MPLPKGERASVGGNWLRSFLSADRDGGPGIDPPELPHGRTGLLEGLNDPARSIRGLGLIEVELGESPVPTRVLALGEAPRPVELVPAVRWVEPHGDTEVARRWRAP